MAFNPLHWFNERKKFSEYYCERKAFLISSLEHFETAKDTYFLLF